MKRTVIAAAVIALFSGLAIAHLVSHPEARAQQQQKGQKWEYRVVIFLGSTKAEAIKSETKKLNDLANEGWEYVGPLSSYSRTYGSGESESYGFVAFRRPKR